MTTRSRNPRLVDLMTVVEQLYPRAKVTLSRVGTDPTALRLVPFPRYPRMVVPAGVPAAAGDALSRPNAGDSKRSAAPRELLSQILSRGLGPALMPYGLTISNQSDSIVEHLSTILDQPVVISLTVGSARANRKPILNVHTQSGEEIGFAKVGLGPLTNSLVRHEATVLEDLPAIAAGNFTLPPKIHSGTWQTHEVLLMGALRPDIKQQLRGIPEGTAAAIITSNGTLEYSRIADSRWLATLQESLEPLRDTDDGALPALLAEFSSTFGSVELPFGAWHGDFGPWNMAHTSTLPMVWDWERYETGVPAGLDVVHFTSHQALRKIGDLSAAREALEHAAPTPLREVVSLAAGEALAHPLQLTTIRLAYLFTIATRFTLDAHTPDGSSVRALARWHHEVIADQLHRMVSAADHEVEIPDDSR